MSLIDAFSTFVGAGGLTGAITGVATLGAKVYERKLAMEEKQLDQTQERARWDYETELHRENAAHERFLAEQELLIESDRIQGEVMTATIEADGREAMAAMKMDGMPWAIGAIRTLTRPVLTATLVVLVALIWFTTQDEGIETLIVSSVLGLAAAAVNYWFSGRVLRGASD